MSDQEWQELSTTGSSNNPIWDYKTQKELIGIYEGMLENVGPNKSKMYTFNTKKGQVSVWGTTLLDDKIPTIPIGNEVKIVYEGKMKNEKTSRNYHSFKIYHRSVEK